jgi:hypothetical protein
MTNIDLSYGDVVRLEQSLVEGIRRYRDLIDAMSDLERKYCSAVYENCIRDWQGLLEQLTSLYPDKPRSWN